MAFPRSCCHLSKLVWRCCGWYTTNCCCHSFKLLASPVIAKPGYILTVICLLRTVLAHSVIWCGCAQSRCNRCLKAQTSDTGAGSMAMLNLPPEWGCTLLCPHRQILRCKLGCCSVTASACVQGGVLSLSEIMGRMLDSTQLKLQVGSQGSACAPLDVCSAALLLDPIHCVSPRQFRQQTAMATAAADAPLFGMPP